MAFATVDGVRVAYDLIGDPSAGRPWVITPGGRFSKDYEGVRELAQAIADRGHHAVVWDRPNCGESDVCFTGTSESAMQADILAGLLRELGLGPTVIIGGSGGSRVSLLTAARHPDVAAGLAMWWISGGTYGLMSLGLHYCSGSLIAAWEGDMAPVVELEEWSEVLERNPRNRGIFLDQNAPEFVATMERWMAAYCACGEELIPGLPDAEARKVTLPTLVFRSGASDRHHTRATSESLAALLPNAELVDPPWGDREWLDRGAAREAGEGSLFSRWHLLAPQLTEWADNALT